jgi:hypothetical protein
MKARLYYLAVSALALTFFFSSCKKDNSTTSEDYTTQSTQHNDDEATFSSENDAAANDINLALESSSGFGRGEGTQSIICDATIVVDSISNPRTITITFNGTPCLPGRTRTGVIVISMAQGVRWRDQGAQINVTFQNFRITRTATNTSITFNGTQTHTNVTGGLLIHLPVLGHITHTITSNNMSITFDNGAQRTWSVGRRRAFTYNNGVVITVTGMHSAGGITGIAEWGTNRFGHNFTTAITTPVVARQDCSFRIGAGAITHAVAGAFTASVLFGLDAQGNPQGCPGAGHYWMRLTWTGVGGNTRTVLIPY